MALNNVTNTVCYWTALTDKPGVVSVPILDPHQLHNFGGVGLGQYTRGDQLATMRADSFNLSKCRLIKVDVEGMESEVLRGASGIIERHHPILYVENDRPANSTSLITLIHSFGYELYWHRPYLYNRDNFFGNSHNEYLNVISQNMLCIHPSQNVIVPDLLPVKIV
jgi:hypothetical protein